MTPHVPVQIELIETQTAASWQIQDVTTRNIFMFIHLILHIYIYVYKYKYLFIYVYVNL